MSQKAYDDGSLADFAHRAVKKIKRYGESDRTKDRLVGFNILIFVLVLGVAISDWLRSTSNLYSFEFAVIFGLSLVFAAVAGYGYSFLIDAVASFSGDSLSGLRLSIVLEMTALTAVWAGLLFGTSPLVKVGVGLLVFQLFAVIFGQIIPLLDDPGESEQEWRGWQEGLGTIANVITVATFVFNLLLFLFRELSG